MKPQISNLKKFLLIPVFLFTYTVLSQTEFKSESNLGCSKIELNAVKTYTTSPITKSVEDKPNAPVLSKAILGLNTKIENVIFENKMVSVRNSAPISSIYRE